LLRNRLGNMPDNGESAVDTALQEDMIWLIDELNFG